MVSGIRDNCIFELKKQPLGNTSLLKRGLGRLLVDLKKQPHPRPLSEWRGE